MKVKHNETFYPPKDTPHNTNFYPDTIKLNQKVRELIDETKITSARQAEQDIYINRLLCNIMQKTIENNMQKFAVKELNKYKIVTKENKKD